MTTAVAIKQQSPAAALSTFLDRFKPQLALALPKHMSADRLARLVLTAYSTTPALQECEPQSIALAMLTAGQLGLEPGVNGACFLVPYSAKDKATDKWVKKAQLIPGWKGLVDLVSRSGRATVWTGAVFAGDEFDYALGDRPFITHRPGNETDPAALLYVYAVGRAKGSEWPVIEVWSMAKIWRHRDRVVAKLPDWQQAKHYSHRDPEMYARKVPLLQVIKYLPTSTEVANAAEVAEAAERGAGAFLDGDFVTVTDERDDEPRTDTAAPPPPPVQRKSAAAAADAPPPPDRIDPSSGEISSGAVDPAGLRITAKQVKYLSDKFASIEAGPYVIAKTLARFGGTTLELLTPEQYDSVKADLLAAGA